MLKTYTRKRININTNQISKKYKNYVLIPLHKITTKQIYELADITNDVDTMKYIGKGEKWTITDIKQFINDENYQSKIIDKKRKYYSFVMLYNNKIIGFISGRKNSKLLQNSSNYDLLLRMFISNKYRNQGLGKLILKLFINKYRKLIKHEILTKNIKLISDIAANNISSIKIHIANGFTYITTIKYPNKQEYQRYIYFFKTTPS